MGNPAVLFVCTHNSARSQMAEGWLRHLAGDRFRVASAGVEPGRVNPLSVRAMAEVGIDISMHEAQGIDSYLGREHFDFVIVVCDQASRTCPRVWPGAAQRIEWSFDDPSAEKGGEAERFAVFRRVRDEIRSRIEQWLSSQPDRAGLGGARQ